MLKKIRLQKVNNLPADGHYRSKCVGDHIFIKLLCFCRCAGAGMNIVNCESISDTCKVANCVAVRNVFVTSSPSNKDLIHSSSWIQHINWGTNRINWKSDVWLTVHRNSVWIRKTN